MIKQTLARHGFDLTPASGGEFTVSCGRVVMFTSTLRGIIAWMRITNLVSSSNSIQRDTAGGSTTAKP